MSHNFIEAYTLSTHSMTFLSDAVLYYELIEEVPVSGRTAYAILARIVYLNGRQNECLVHDITSDKAVALAFYHKIIRGTVTPCTLTEVLSDLLAEY